VCTHRSRRRFRPPHRATARVI